ncbi:MAG: ABC transporter permease subunit [Myxococcota bacterium]
MSFLPAWLETLVVLLPGELRMQLRQRMTVVMVLLLPVVGLPAAISGTAAYQSSVADVERATRAREAYPVDNQLPVSVPDEMAAWIRETDGLRLVPPDEALATVQMDGRQVTVRYAPTLASTQAQARLVSVVRRQRIQLRDAALATAGIPSEAHYGLEVAEEDVDAGKPRGAVLIVPLAMLVMLMTSAFTALDVLTGERERGTLETLLTTGADRRGVILAKTAVVGLFTLAAGWLGVVGVAGAGAIGVPGVPALGAAQTAGLAFAVALLAAIASSLAVAFAVSAPNYRSASLTMGAVLLVPAVPAGLGAFSFELTPAMAMVPIGNVSLAARDALAGTLSAGDAVLVALVSLAWAAFAVGVTSGRIASEGALLQVQDTAALRRAGFFGRQAAGIFGLSLLLCWVVGGPVQAVDATWGLLGTELVLIAGLGLAGGAWVGLPLGDTLSLRIPRPPDLVLALVAGLCAPGLGYVVLQLQEPFLPVPRTLAEGRNGQTTQTGGGGAGAAVRGAPAVCGADVPKARCSA